MSQATYKTAIQFTLKWEVGLDKMGNLRTDGGYHNDPQDPGGETKWGIAKRWHPDVDIKNLTLEGALDIYRKEYWDAYKSKTPSLDLDTSIPELAISVFDCGVNCGINRAYGWYLKALNSDNPTDAFNQYRQSFYNNEPPHVRGGLLARLNDLKKLVDIVRQDAS